MKSKTIHIIFIVGSLLTSVLYMLIYIIIGVGMYRLFNLLF